MDLPGAAAPGGDSGVTCRSVTVWFLRGPSRRPSSTVLSARSYLLARPRSSVHVMVVTLRWAGQGRVRCARSAGRPGRGDVGEQGW